jgi:hypothetical protein
MNVDFGEFVTDAPGAGGGGGGSSVDDLLDQLNNHPAPAASAAPVSAYRPSAPPSYAPPAQFAARQAPSTSAFSVLGGGGGSGSGGGGGSGAKPAPAKSWWDTIFGSKETYVGSATSSSFFPLPQTAAAAAAARVDSAALLRKRKRKLLREMRTMLKADAAARARARMENGAVDEDDEDGGGEDGAVRMRVDESSSLEEIEDEHDLVSSEHNERAGMDTARTAFVSLVGQVESYNDENHPFGEDVQLQGMKDLVKSSIGDYEADLQSIRESVMGMGLPQWCFTGVKLGINAAVIVAMNRNVRKMVDAGVMDASVAYHPEVRDVIRRVTMRNMAEQVSGSLGGGSLGGGGRQQQFYEPPQPHAAPPPMYANNKPRPPDPDSLPAPGSGSRTFGAGPQFVSDTQAYRPGALQSPPQMQPQPPQMPPAMPPPQMPAQYAAYQHHQQQHDPYSYVPPAVHAVPTVGVPLPRPGDATTRDAPGDRAAYLAQQRAFQDAQRHPPLRGGALPPQQPQFGAPSGLPLRFAQPAAHEHQQQQQWQQHEEDAATADDYDAAPPTDVDYVDFAVREDEDESGGDATAAGDDAMGASEDYVAPVAAAPRRGGGGGGGGKRPRGAEDDAASVASSGTGGGRRRRRARATADDVIEDDMVLDMM